jgi:hypothetical protein
MTAFDPQRLRQSPLAAAQLHAACLIRISINFIPNDRKIDRLGQKSVGTAGQDERNATMGQIAFSSSSAFR